MAVGHQHGYHHYYVSDGVPDPEHTKPRWEAIQLKLDELLRAVTEARTSLVDLEDMSDEELERLQKEFQQLRQLESRKSPLSTSGTLAEPHNTQRLRVADP